MVAPAPQATRQWQGPSKAAATKVSEKDHGGNGRSKEVSQI